MSGGFIRDMPRWSAFALGNAAPLSFCRIVPIVTIAGYLLSSHLRDLMSVVSSITTSNNSGCTDAGAKSAPLLSSCSKLLFYVTFGHKRSFSSSSSSSSKSLLYVTCQHKRYFK